MSQDYASRLAAEAELCLQATARVVTRHNQEHPGEPTTVDDELVAAIRHYTEADSLKLPVYEAALSLSRHLHELNPNRSDRERNAEILAWQRPSYGSHDDGLGRSL